MRVAVLMLNLGGPERLQDVRPFLQNLFNDRDAIRFPGGSLGQRVFAWGLAALRWRASAASYARIGGGSPLVRWTRAQGNALAAQIGTEDGVSVLALPCMRYWHPRAEEALERALQWGAEHVVAFSQYPHRCAATTDSSLRELRAVAARRGVGVPITEIVSWHDHPAYVAALAECVADALRAVPEPHRAGARVLYSAHSLPLKLVESGDPYPGQVRATVELVHRAAGVPQRAELAWQSKVGPARWLAPSTAERLAALPDEGTRDVVVVPVSFTSDHVETLHEIDIELRALALRAGMRTFVRAPALNTRPAFVAALAAILRDHLDAHGVGARRDAS